MAHPLVRMALLLALPVGVLAAEWPPLDLYARVIGQVERTGLPERTLPELVYASLRGLVQAVDPHSNFYDPPTWRRLEAIAGGAQVGIGLGLEPDPCGRRVTSVLPGGPAAHAGVLPGECLSHVAGQPTVGLPDEALAGLLAGEAGVEVELTLRRGDEPARRVLLLRSRLVSPSVHATARGGALVLRIEEFRDHAADELRAHLGGPTPDAIVLDLRDNPGGRLDQAVQIVDLFLATGVIVRTTGRTPGTERAWAATPEVLAPGVPIVVLVDGGTASAAEIVAGALQEAGRARLVGRPTYGKSTVQSLYHYEDGSALKLTEARWSLDSGRAPTPGAPLTPDLAVDSPGGDPKAHLRDRVRRLSLLSDAEREGLLDELEHLPLVAPPAAPAGDSDLDAAIQLMAR